MAAFRRRSVSVSLYGAFLVKGARTADLLFAFFLSCILSFVRPRRRLSSAPTARDPKPMRATAVKDGAPTLGGDGKANAWPRVKDLGLREKVIGQLRDPLPRVLVLLTAAPQRMQPETHDMVADGAECRKVGRGNGVATCCACAAVGDSGHRVFTSRPTSQVLD
jgi:hypothetical protein